MSVESLLATNVRSDALVTVAVENGDDAPLPLHSVELQMRQRTLCFEAEPGAEYLLRYGDASPVRSPVYDYARLFQASQRRPQFMIGYDSLEDPGHHSYAETVDEVEQDRR